MRAFLASSQAVPTDSTVSVTEAAEQLGITRSAVVKAAQAGRLKGKKIGKTWALLKRSVESYQVAKHRVRAGKAARVHGRATGKHGRRDEIRV